MPILKDHVNKLAFLTDASAKRGGGRKYKNVLFMHAEKNTIQTLHKMQKSISVNEHTLYK